MQMASNENLLLESSNLRSPGDHKSSIDIIDKKKVFGESISLLKEDQETFR
jgi:hypothetical protein